MKTYMRNQKKTFSTFQQCLFLILAPLLRFLRQPARLNISGDKMATWLTSIITRLVYILSSIRITLSRHRFKVLKIIPYVSFDVDRPALLSPLFGWWWPRLELLMSSLAFSNKTWGAWYYCRPRLFPAINRTRRKEVYPRAFHGISRIFHGIRLSWK